MLGSWQRVCSTTSIHEPATMQSQNTFMSSKSTHSAIQKTTRVSVNKAKASTVVQTKFVACTIISSLCAYYNGKFSFAPNTPLVLFDGGLPGSISSVSKSSISSSSGTSGVSVNRVCPSRPSLLESVKDALPSSECARFPRCSAPPGI
jgi:hypothetical protein